MTRTADGPGTPPAAPASEVALPISLDARIRAAAAIARLDKDVETFPKGYHTLVGERGITLSGGQKQRTAIARALMVDPRVLVLDDALSAVDTYTEEEILARLRGVMRQRTSLIVSHRVSTVRDADRIVVLDRGRIVEEGRHVRTEHVTGTPRTYRGRFRRSWTDHEAQIVAVDAGDRVVGHVYIQREAHPVTRHVATLGIAVSAAVRGRGVGTALMAEALRWARSVGVDKIVLSVYPHNTGAIALYRKFGFVEEGRLARHSRKSYGDEDEILMAAWIGDRGDGSAEDRRPGDEA